MNNITTFETSKALIAAGFPVPDVAICQVWYNDLGFASVIIKKVDGNFVAASLLDGEIGNDFSEGQIKSFCIPAFIATDILRELGEDYSIVFWPARKNGFEILNIIGLETQEHRNPAEAAALAYLLKNKQ